ncbi:hypothetical protein HYT18_01360 [Candidatus Microgenomates bacterium]|nr:hypothetical protein [Candidatus Microgenomates bacterium]
MISKKSVLIVVFILGMVLVSLKLSLPKTDSLPQTSKQQVVNQNVSEASPQIISTKPDPLEEAIISSTEVIEITFNRSLENEGELKVRIDPKIDFEIKLSQDRKVGKIIPKTPYELGTTYTLFIGPDTKFDGVGRWGEEKIFHFKTITYRGV